MNIRIAALVVGMSVLAGCGASPVDEAPKPPKTYAAQELKAALPELKDIPGGKEVTSSCPGSKDCVDPDEGQVWIVEFDLKSKSEVAAESAENASFDQFGFVRVTLSDNNLGAAAELAKGRKVNAEYDGEFSTPAEEGEGNSYTAGQKGHGAVVDTAVDGWSGFLSDRAFVLTSPEGEASGPRQESTVKVSKGRVTVAATVAIGGKELGKDGAQKLARQLVEGYLARLG